MKKNYEQKTRKQVKNNNKEKIYLLQIFQNKYNTIGYLRLYFFLFLILPIITQKSISNHRLLEGEQKIIIKVLNPGNQNVINPDFILSTGVTVEINGNQVAFVDNKINIQKM